MSRPTAMLCASALAWVGAIAVPRFAHAQTASPTRARVVRPTCTNGPFDVAVFLSVLPAQLATDGVDRTEVASSADATDAATDTSLATISIDVIPCGPDARFVVITIDDRATRKSVRSVVDLGDVARPERARTLALAVAELLRASWAELALPDAPAPAVPVAARVVQAVARERAVTSRAPRAATNAVSLVHPVERLRPFSAGISVEARWFPSLSSWLAGGRATLALRPARAMPLRVRIDAGGGGGVATTSAGPIDLAAVTGGAALAFVGGSPSVLFEIGPRIEVGSAWATGRPDAGFGTGSTGSGAAVLASLTARVRIRLTPGVWAEIEAEAGTSLLGLVALAESPSGAAAERRGVGGPLLGLRVGVAVEP